MIIGRKVIVKDEVASTNDLAKAMANEGEEEGLVVTARTQVAGRGRMGRSWSSPEGGLYLSVILRPKVPVEDMLRLTVLACVPVAETIEESSGCKTLVKWPNDVEIGARRPRTAGRIRIKGNDIAYMVLGIGVNLNIEPAVLGVPEATSVSACSGKPVDRDAFLNLLLCRLDTFYSSFLKGTLRWPSTPNGRPPSALRSRCGTGGTRLVGKATGVDVTGALTILAQDGSVHRLTSVHETTVVRSNR